MTLRNNILAILETHFTGYKDEVIEAATDRIMWQVENQLPDAFIANGIRYTRAADAPQTEEFKNFDREALILLIECQKERIAELLADKDTPQTAEKVEEFQALCGVEIDPDDINRRVANAYAECGMNESQTDCCWR